MPSPDASPASPWRRFTTFYARILTFLLAMSVAILVIPVTLQIISRYTALIPSYIWTEEMARFLFIWTIMIGAMIGVRESTHFEVDVWPQLSRRGEAMVRLAGRLGVLAAGFFLGDAQKTGRTPGEACANSSTPTTDCCVPCWWPRWRC